ncbi:uncharacterized protein TNCV_3782161 [Trichonephila clavipes]|nr:uncharacterized protein TNCV_3782161 [Trichonephila clavipes]
MSEKALVDHIFVRLEPLTNELSLRKDIRARQHWVREIVVTWMYEVGMSVGCLILVIIVEIGEILKWCVDRIMVEMIIGVTIRTTVKEINVSRAEISFKTMIADLTIGDINLEIEVKMTILVEGTKEIGVRVNILVEAVEKIGRLNVLKLSDIKGDQTQSINHSQIKLSAICMSPVELPYVPIL